MSIDAKQIDAIVDQVVRKLSKELRICRSRSRSRKPPQGHADDRRGSERRYGTYARARARRRAHARARVPPGPPGHLRRSGLAPPTAASAAFEAWGDDLAGAAATRSSRRCARPRAATPSELAEMAVKETGLGQRQGQDPEEPAVREQDAGPGDPPAGGLHRRPRPGADRAGAVRRHRRHHPDDQPHRDDHQQRHRHGRRRQRGGVQRAPERQEGLRALHPAAQRGHRLGGRAGEPASARWPSRPSTRRRR